MISSNYDRTKLLFFGNICCTTYRLFIVSIIKRIINILNTKALQLIQKKSHYRKIKIKTYQNQFNKFQVHIVGYNYVETSPHPH